MTDKQEIKVCLVEDNALFRMEVQRGVNSLDGMTWRGSFTSAEAAFSALDTERTNSVAQPVRIN